MWYPRLNGRGFPSVLILPQVAFWLEYNLHTPRPLGARVLLKAARGACGIITIMPFRNGPEKSPVKCGRQRYGIPVGTQKKPHLIKRSEKIYLHPSPPGGSHPLPFVNTRGKLYIHFTTIFLKYLRRWGRMAKGAEGEAGGRAKQGDFIIGRSEKSASFIAKFPLRILENRPFLALTAIISFSLSFLRGDKFLIKK